MCQLSPESIQRAEDLLFRRGPRVRIHDQPEPGAVAVSPLVLTSVEFNRGIVVEHYDPVGPFIGGCDLPAFFKPQAA